MTVADLPPVILGDHGFMQLYGSTLTDEEIVDRMGAALSAGLPMLSAGDLRLPALVTRAFARHGRPAAWVQHMDAPLELDGGTPPFGRAMATLRRAGVERLGEPLLRDPIMGPFLARHARSIPLDAAEAARLRLGQRELDAREEVIRSFRPAVVTVGGDATDFLLAAGRADLLGDLFARIGAAAAAVGAQVFACSYLGVAWADEFDAIVSRADVKGLMVPANIAGAGMLPDAETARAFWRRHEKPVLAMHALAIGVLPTQTALPAVLGWPEVTAAVVGASTPAHIIELARVRRVLALDPEIVE